MRVVVTKRMLKEGVLRCLQAKPLSKITVSDLCRESGVNRATFYNHYTAPVMIVREIARDYADHLAVIYKEKRGKPDDSDEAALGACLEYIYEHKTEIKVLFSDNAEHCLSGFSLEIIRESEEKKRITGSDSTKLYDDSFLLAIANASATFGLIQIWLTLDIDKTPKELVSILKQSLRGNFFS